MWGCAIQKVRGRSLFGSWSSQAAAVSSPLSAGRPGTNTEAELSTSAIGPVRHFQAIEEFFSSDTLNLFASSSDDEMMTMTDGHCRCCGPLGIFWGGAIHQVSFASTGPVESETA